MSIALPPWRTDFYSIEVSAVPADAKLRVTIDAVGDRITAPGDAASAPFPKTLSIPSLSERIDLTAIEDLPEGQRVLSRVQNRAASLVIDSAELLPQLQLSIRGDPARPTIDVWFSPAAGDGIWAGMSWGQPKPKINWTLLLPPSPGSFRMPEIPPTLGAFLPRGDLRGGIATLFDRSSIDRWSLVRSAPTDSMRHAVTRAQIDTMLRFSQARR
jgi:hypothetical protein